MNAAVYARRSTEQKSADPEAKSVATQIEQARTFAAEQGWTVADQHVFFDDAVSGGDLRKLRGRQRLLDIIQAGAPFQVLIVREQSRFSRRDGDEAIGELKQIVRAGVQVWFYKDRQRFSFGSFGENVVGYVKAEAAADYRRQIAGWTYDAMVHRARAGYVCGNRLFGYKNQRVDGHTERTVDPTEARVVVEIFRRAAAGQGMRTIAKELNATGAPSPRAQQGRIGGWAPSSVREVLYRGTYHGAPSWNKSKKRDATGEQRQHDRPSSEWITVQAEHLRIVPEDLWRAVHERLQQKRAPAIGAPPLAAGRGIRRRYFLTGFGACVQCGGSMQIVSRASSGGRNFRYVCATYWNRGTTVCANKMAVAMPLADEAIGDLLRTEILQPRIVGRAIELAVKMVQRERGDGSHIDRLQRQLARLDVDLANLAETAARGGAVPAVLDLLARRDEERRRVAADLAQHARALPMPSEKALRGRLTGFLSDWHALLGANPQEARAVLDGVLTDRIRFEPIPDEHRYRLTVPIDFGRVVIAAVPELNGVTRNDGVPNASQLEPDRGLARPNRPASAGGVNAAGHSETRATCGPYTGTRPDVPWPYKTAQGRHGRRNPDPEDSKASARTGGGG